MAPTRWSGLGPAVVWSSGLRLLPVCTAMSSALRLPGWRDSLLETWTGGRGRGRYIRFEYCGTYQARCPHTPATLGRFSHLLRAQCISVSVLRRPCRGDLWSRSSRGCVHTHKRSEADGGAGPAAPCGVNTGNGGCLSGGEVGIGPLPTFQSYVLY